MKNKRWAAVDCETDSFDGEQVEAFIWGVITDEGEASVFDNTADFVLWAEQWDGILYAHNGGKFDWLMEGIIEKLDRGKIMIINGRLAKARLGKTELRDSWLCLPVALAATGEKDTDFNYSLLNRNNKKERVKHYNKIKKYLLQDCLALRAAMRRFIDMHGQRLTQAGAAMAEHENNGGRKRRYGPGHDIRWRQWYAGGRCECYVHGEVDKKINVYDINSSYPAVMMLEHCAGTEYRKSDDYINAPGSSFWIVEGVSNGALWTRDEKTGRLWWPRDNEKRLYFCTGWELNAGIDTGTLEVISAVGQVPVETESFRDYITRHYDRRLKLKNEGDNIGQLLEKLLMNSLYGKYGSNPFNYKEYEIVEPGERREGWEIEIMLDTADIIARPAKVNQYFDVAVAASITGAARANLWRGICSSDGVLYCDTDSIFCAGKSRVKIGDKLGEWEHEAVARKGHFVGKKSYALKTGKGWKTAHKGLSAMDVTVNDIIKASKGEHVVVKKKAPCIKMGGEQVFFNRTLKIT